jgi:5-methylcytosine-specific restriction endonuclease McrA
MPRNDHIGHVRYPANIPTVGKSRAARESRAAVNRFYASVRWRRFRRLYLFDHPMCEECLERGVIVPAVIVHHVKERLDRPDLAYEESNMRALCSPCHTRHHKRGPAAGETNYHA